MNSEYQDGGNPVDHDVWTMYCNPFSSKKTFSGVMASLSKKGFVRISTCTDMGTVAITRKGMDAFTAAK